MISKERLQELINQGATIYYVVNNEICSLELTFRHNIYLAVEGCFICLYGDKGLQIYDNRIFETKEDAEKFLWHEEFGCIERTERLELPTWEEFLKMKKLFSFKSKKGKIIVYFYDNNTIFVEDDEWNILREPLTKENYTLACRKCKELFLGESNEEKRHK